MEILIDCLFGKAIEDWFPQTSEIIATIVFGISMYIFIMEKYTLREKAILLLCICAILTQNLMI